VKWFIAHWAIPAMVFPFLSITGVCAIGVSFNITDSSRFLFICDIVNVPSEMFTGERPTEFDALSLNFGASINGAEAAAGGDQGDGMFHGGGTRNCNLKPPIQAVPYYEGLLPMNRRVYLLV